MSFLDVFALIILAVLLITTIVAVGILGAMPGWVAHRRGHPQAEAIAVGGWLGLLFGGLFWPLAMIWAYTRTVPKNSKAGLLPESTKEDAL